MLANSALWNVRHPMKHLPLDSKVYLAEDGVTEIVGPGYEDLRFFVIAMVDPFDLIGLAMGRHTRKEFWKEQGQSKTVDEEAAIREEDVENAAGVTGDVDADIAGNEEVLEKVVVAEETGSSSGPLSEPSKNPKSEGS